MLALDANVIIDLTRGDDAVRLNFDRVPGDTPMWISAFVFQELLFGVDRNERPDRERRKLAPILADLDVIAFEPADAIVGGRTRALMENAGRRAPLGDFIVGVHALSRGATIVTANTRHFEHIPGLKLLNWRLPPEAQEATDA